LPTHSISGVLGARADASPASPTRLINTGDRQPLARRWWRDMATP
jgi:hypothetical protein